MILINNFTNYCHKKPAENDYILKASVLSKVDEIYKENYNTMLGVARKMLGNGYDASDIIHDVFIEFFEKSDKGTIIKYPKSWLYRVTLNKCVDKLRQCRNHKDIEDVYDKAEKTNQVEIMERKALVGLALSKLKTNERELVVMYSEGLSYKEISGITGIKFSSIGKMLSRTLQKIERELKKLGYEVY